VAASTSSSSSIAAEAGDTAAFTTISVPDLGISFEDEVDTLAERVVESGDGQTPSGPCTQLAVEDGIDCPDDGTGPTWIHTVE
jgi:hypothetical protein